MSTRLAIAVYLTLTLLAAAGSSVRRAEETLHGANSLFVSPTVKIAWAVQTAVESKPTVIIRVVNIVGAHRQIRLDGVDPFTKQRTIFATLQAIRGQIDLSMPRDRFREFPSCEIRLYLGDRVSALTRRRISRYITWACRIPRPSSRRRKQWKHISQACSEPENSTEAPRNPWMRRRRPQYATAYLPAEHLRSVGNLLLPVC